MPAGTTQTANAATTVDCQANISELRTATQAATFAGQNAADAQPRLAGAADAVARIERAETSTGQWERDTNLDPVIAT